MKSSRKSVVYLVLIGLVLLVTAGLILWHQGHRPDSARPMVSARPADDVVVRKEVEKIVTVEKEITADVIQDGLNDVGVLVTEEYYFTEVVGFSSIKKLFKKLELGITESSYLASYDGVVTAGIDFTKITVSKDSELHMVEVRLPKAEILNVDIDPESFELYSEKTGLGNPISAEDFNSSLVELENTASEKAIERGILDRADQNAKTVVKNFIAGLINPSEYTVLFLADIASTPETHTGTIASIDEKTDTVLKLTATSTLASAAVSAIPGDTATPIANKLADFTEYFLLILCVLYSEKYLLTIIGAGAFKILIPLACLLMIAGMFWNPRVLKRLAVKFAIIGLAFYLVIPMSIRVSDMIYNAYRESIDTTISSAEALSDQTAALADAAEDKNVINSILSRLSETADSLTDKAANILNRFVETLAVMIVTSCIIPILVLIFFLWLIKLLTGIDLSGSLPLPRGERRRPEPHVP